MRKNKVRAFTLVELLVVIGIIALLISIFVAGRLHSGPRSRRIQSNAFPICGRSDRPPTCMPMTSRDTSCPRHTKS